MVLKFKHKDNFMGGINGWFWQMFRIVKIFRFIFYISTMMRLKNTCIYVFCLFLTCYSNPDQMMENIIQTFEHYITLSLLNNVMVIYKSKFFDLLYRILQMDVEFCNLLVNMVFLCNQSWASIVERYKKYVFTL